MLHIAAFLANMGDLLNISAGSLTYINMWGEGNGELQWYKGRVKTPQGAK